MASRLKLHEEFVNILESGGEYDERVYYQPPESIKMRYPCIKYSRNNIDTKYANDHIYLGTNRYEGIVIDHDQDSEIIDKILRHFPMCSLDRIYTANDLYHFAFTIYY